jgi:hypothetical protein
MVSIPSMLKHMTLAVFHSGSIHAPVRERFKQAFDIAVSQLKKHGYITGGGSSFQLTVKGLKRHHHSEGARGAVKDRMFDSMYMDVMQQKAQGAEGPTPPELAAHVLGNQDFPKDPTK